MLVVAAMSAIAFASNFLGFIVLYRVLSAKLTGTISSALHKPVSVLLTPLRGGETTEARTPTNSVENAT
jgi:hypothetical protein